MREPEAADADADADLEAEPEDGEALTAADVLEAVEAAEVLRAKLPMVLSDVHIDEEGIGCAEGVLGSPWKNVDVP